LEASVHFFSANPTVLLKRPKAQDWQFFCPSLSFLLPIWQTMQFSPPCFGCKNPVGHWMQLDAPTKGKNMPSWQSKHASLLVAAMCLLYFPTSQG
jgi:hypothetical protein